MARSLRLWTLLLLFSLLSFLEVSLATEAKEEDEKPHLRDEADVDAIRTKAIKEIEEREGKPLEKFKAKDLKQLLTDRGVACTACSEKSQLLKTVRESMHLPIKKDHLKKINMPREVDDEEMQSFIKEMKKKKQQENEIKEKLKAQGINTDGLNFGGFSGFSDEQMEAILKGARGSTAKETGKGSEL